METTDKPLESSLKQESARSAADHLESKENLINLEAVQVSPLEESSFVRFAHRSRKMSHQFGWPALFLILIGPSSTDSTPNKDNFPFFLLIGILPVLCGLGLRLWARGFKRDEGFVLDGPYRYVRNPVELGAMMVYAGAAIIAGLKPWYIGVSALITMAYLSAVASSYESDILRKIGGPYLRYCRRVGRWIPNSHPGTNRTQRTFSSLHAFGAERESLIWIVGYLCVFAARYRIPELTRLINF
jgi:hypothetical protein